MAEILKAAVVGNKPFWFLAISALGLFVTGLLLPPLGKIDGSVISAVGEMLGFGALFAINNAIEKGTSAKVRHGGTTIEVGKKQEKMMMTKKISED